MPQTKRPIVPETLVEFTPVSDPQASPDGSMVAYVVSRLDLEQNKSTSSIWVAPVGGGKPRRLTGAVKGSDRAPRWSPDGSCLAFISDRSGRPQLYVLELAGGEARCVETRQRPGAPVWSPDGTLIAFQASVFDKPADWEPYPGAPESDRRRAEEAANHEPNGNGQEKGGKKPSDVKVITRLRFRMDGQGYFGDKRAHLFVVPADGSGPARQVSSGDFDHQFPAFSPDGRWLYCTALRSDDADHQHRADIWRFAVGAAAPGGAGLAPAEPELVYDSPGPAFDLQLSPDGRHLLFGGHESQHKNSTSLHLICLPLSAAGLAEGRAFSLTARLDRPVGAHGLSDVRGAGGMTAGRWAPDGKSAYCLLGERGNSQLYRLPLDGSAPVRLTRGDDRTVSDFAVGPNGAVAAQIGDGAGPDDLYWLEEPGQGDAPGYGEERRLTDQNSQVRDLAVSPPERFSYTGAGGWPMEGWLIKPAGYEPGRRYPTVLAIHGGPHGQFGSDLMIQYQVLASAGMAVVYTNPRGSQTYGQEFALAVVQDWGGSDFADIMAGVDKAIEMGVADPERLGVLGWSYGGFMTAWTVTQTDRFKAAIAGAPVIDQYSMIGTTDISFFTEWHAGGNPWEAEGGLKLLERSPIRHADRVTTPVLVVAGEGDLRCPISQAEEFYLALKRIGKAPAVHIRYPGEFHGIAQPKHKVDRYERYLAWFRYHLMY